MAWANDFVLAMALAATLAIAAALRLINLTAVGFNSDEAVYSGQAAAMAGAPELSELFPMFRAHPLLFQFTLSFGYLLDLDHMFGRVMAALCGVATVYVVYLLGRLLYGRRAGVLAALFMALIPYHVVVSRQVLLDAPMTLMATLCLYFLARFALYEQRRWLYAAGAAMGLTFLSKETGVLFLGAVYAFFALCPSIRVRIVDLAISFGIMLLVMLPHPLSVLVAGKTDTGGQYFIWQLFRRPNHDWWFYPSTVPESMGIALIVVAAAGLWLLRKHGSWREVLLLSWIVVPVAFFQLWPVKGYQYLLPVAPAVAVLAARTLGPYASQIRFEFRGREVAGTLLAPAVTVVVVLSLLIPSIQKIGPGASSGFLAGSGGVPGGREAGQWVRANTPEGATLLTIGPSMANLLQFYGNRQAYGLSVSPNPLHRNPSYEAVTNPDQLIRSSDVQYIVWDAYSASRSAFFSDRVLGYVDRYNGRAVHTQTAKTTTQAGERALRPLIVIYEVRP
jgi:4-amino-4-deoxy-L-arabinose transferase-like glycosyltransferase